MATRKTAKPRTAGGQVVTNPGQADLTAWGIGATTGRQPSGPQAASTPDFSGISQAPQAGMLDILRTMASTLREKLAEVQRRSEALEIATSDLSLFQLVTIPEAMEAAAVKSFELEDGAVLTVKPGVKASITEVNRPLAHEWLRAMGHGTLVKVNYVVDVRALTEKQRASLLTKIDKSGAAAQVNEAVHSSSLASLVKELLEEGTTLPPSISVFQYKKAELKEPKVK